MAHVSNGKPLLVGPIGAGTQAGKPPQLVIPFQLQGDWRDTDDGEEILSTTSGNIAAAIEDRLIELGRFKRENIGTDSPVILDAPGDENKMFLRVECKDSDEARMLAELAKAHPDMKKNCQNISMVEVK
jgi:hypothetical protein